VVFLYNIGSLLRLQPSFTAANIKECINQIILFAACVIGQGMVPGILSVSTAWSAFRRTLMLLISYYAVIYSRACVVVQLKSVTYPPQLGLDRTGAGAGAGPPEHPRGPMPDQLNVGDVIRSVGGALTGPLAAGALAQALDGGSPGAVLELSVLRRAGPLPYVPFQKFRRNFGAENLNVTIRKGVIAEESVRVHINAHNVTILNIRSFQESTFQEVKNALRLKSGFAVGALVRGLRVGAGGSGRAGGRAGGLVIDLRGNSGGDLSSALQVASLFVPFGRTLSRVYHDCASASATAVKHRDTSGNGGNGGKYSMLHHIRGLLDLSAVRNTNVWPDIHTPLLLLTDHRTASAAEVLAWCLSDHRRAASWGGVTFGKALAQVSVHSH
jgi:C-terminal processing protease CtpA/Prc